MSNSYELVVTADGVDVEWIVSDPRFQRRIMQLLEDLDEAGPAAGSYRKHFPRCPPYLWLCQGRDYSSRIYEFLATPAHIWLWLCARLLKVYLVIDSMCVEI